MKSFKHSLLLGAASVLMYNSSLFASEATVVASVPVQVTAQPGVQVGTAENKLEVAAGKEPAVTLNVAPVAEVAAAPLAPVAVAPIAPVAAPLTVIDGEAPTTVSAQNRAANAIEELMNKKLEEVPVQVAGENEDLSAHHVDQVEAVAEKEIALSGEENSSEVVPAKKAKGSKKAKLTDAEIAQLKEDGAAKTAARKAAKEQAALGEHEEVMSPPVELANASEEEIAAPVAHHVDQAEHVVGENEAPSAHHVDHVDQAKHVAGENEAPSAHHVDQAQPPVVLAEEPKPTFAVIVETEVNGKQAISLTATQEHAFNKANQPEEPTKIIVAPVEAPTAVNGAVADSSEHHDAKAIQEEAKEEPVKKEEPLIVEGTKNGPVVDVTHAEDGVVNAEHHEAAAEKHDAKEEGHHEAAPTGDHKDDVKKVEEHDVKPDAHAAA